MIDKDIAEKIKTSPDWQAVDKHIKEAVIILNQLSDIPDDWDNDKRATELVARKRAISILKHILEPFEVEPPKPTNQSLKKYGIDV